MASDAEGHRQPRQLAKAPDRCPYALRRDRGPPGGASRRSDAEIFEGGCGGNSAPFCRQPPPERGSVRP
eukprot:7299383-Lingulodinium_polyedra.AAC.1